MCRDRAKKVHPTITNKIVKLKNKLDEINNNPLVLEDNKMLESLATKTEIL